MTRSTLSSAARTESVSPVVHVGELIDIAFPSGTLRVTSGTMPVSYNGNTYNVTPLVNDALSDYAESSDGKARGATIGLSGVDATLRNKILTDAFSFVSVNVTLAFYNETWSLIASYPIAVNRLLSVASVSTGSTDTTLTIESPQILADRDSAVLSSPETQRLRYTGDTGMDRAASLIGMQLEWGGKIETVIGGGRPVYTGGSRSGDRTRNRGG